jgi:hypothetical protein
MDMQATPTAAPAALIPERLARIEALPLKSGSHGKNSDLEMCVMEAAAYVAGEPWSDHPACACPVITDFMISWNDSLPNDAERDRLLKPLIALVVNTRSTPAVEEKRSYMALDWLIRVHTPKWLEMVPALHEHAKALRELDAIVDMGGATAAGVKVRLASTDAAAAWDAARAAAWDAARAAAWDAARDAAWAAAGDAAWDAAWDAARAATRAAAWDAARAATRAAAGDAARAATRAAAGAAAGAVLKPTTAWLQTSAVDLVKRMCSVEA